MTLDNDESQWIKLGSTWKKMDSKEREMTVKDMVWSSICNLDLHATLKVSDLDIQKIIAYLDQRSTKPKLKGFSKDAFTFIAVELQQLVAPDSDFEKFHLRSVGGYFDLDYMIPVN
jgi:hypothetical protein